jgi:excisionase family DNA binding protein
METTTPEFLRPIEACLALKISRSKLYEALASGDIPSVRIAGLMRIPRRWIDEQVQSALAAVAPERDRNG